MSGYLLDTNVISELLKSTPHPRVTGFLSAHQDLWLCSIVIHELQYGLQRMPQSTRSAALREALLDIATTYGDRVLPLEREGAESAARFRAQVTRSGCVLDLGDALIAGTAKANRLALVTKNTRNFDHLPLTVVNPWE